MSNKWIILQAYKAYPPALLFDFIQGRAQFFQRSFGHYLESALLHNMGITYTCLAKKSYDLLTRILLHDVQQNPESFRRRYRRGYTSLQRHEELTHKVDAWLARRTKSIPVKLLYKWRRAFLSMAMIGQPMNLLEFHEAQFSQLLEGIVAKRFSSMGALRQVEIRIAMISGKYGPYRERIISYFHAHPQEKQLFRLAGDAMQSKEARDRGKLKYNKTTRRLAVFAANRLSVTPEMLLQSSTRDIILALQADDISAVTYQVRDPGGVMFCRGKVAQLSTAAVSSITATDKKIMALQKLKGTCAVPGAVHGRVSIVDLPSDMKKVKQGDIIVSHTTGTKLMPALKKAAAIVTDMGGITSHGAVVSRELGIPCVIGTKIATKVFKDGDRVEVDATKGVIRKI